MRKFSAAVLTLMLFNSAPAFSEDKKENVQPQTNGLVDEIMNAIDAEKMTESEKAEFDKKLKDRYNHAVDVIADKMHMSDEEKTKIKERMAEKHEQHKSMPPEVKEKLEKMLEIKSFTREMSYQVLGDHLDKKDLRTILKFIKSTTGKKLLKEGPDMMSEALELAAERYVPMMLEGMKRMQECYKQQRGGDPEKQKELIDKLQKMLKDNNKPAGPTEEQNKAPEPAPGKNEI